MPKYLQVRKKSLPLHPHLRNNGSYKYNEGFAIRGSELAVRLNFSEMQKFFLKSFGRLKKITYLCNPFRTRTKFGSKKIFKKDLVITKIVLTFAIPIATKTCEAF